MDTPNVSDQVVHAVATANDTDPLDLPPLYDTLDPDALDGLARESTACTVTFDYAGCRVTVESGRSILVDGRPVPTVAADAAGVEATD